MLKLEFNNLIDEMDQNIVTYDDVVKYHYKLIGLYNLNKNAEFKDILNLIKFERDTLCFKIINWMNAWMNLNL